MSKGKAGLRGFLSRVCDKLLDYWAGAVAFLVIAVLLFIRDLFLEWVNTSITLPIWVLLLIGLFGFSVITMMIVIIKRQRSSKPPVKAKWELYTHDRFLADIDWYWTYRGNQIAEYRMICAKCNGTIRLERVCWGVGNYGTVLRCQSCGFTTKGNAPASTALELGNWLADRVSQSIREKRSGPPGFALQTKPVPDRITGY